MESTFGPYVRADVELYILLKSIVGQSENWPCSLYADVNVGRELVANENETTATYQDRLFGVIFASHYLPTVNNFKELTSSFFKWDQQILHSV